MFLRSIKHCLSISGCHKSGCFLNFMCSNGNYIYVPFQPQYYVKNMTHKATYYSPFQTETTISNLWVAVHMKGRLYECLYHTVPSSKKFEARISCSFWSVASRSPCSSFSLCFESLWQHSGTQVENLLGSLSSALSRVLPATHVLRSLIDTFDTEGSTVEMTLLTSTVISSLSLSLVCLSFFICHVRSCNSLIPANCLLSSVSLVIGLMSSKHEVSLFCCVADRRGVLCRRSSWQGGLSSK